MALSQVANHPVEVCCAGRTDAGVHAVGQVVHFNTQALRSLRAWIYGTNTHLPATVRVLWASEVDPDFDARRSASSRTYHYFIYNSPIRPALLNRQVTWCYRALSVEAMHEAAQQWLGEHDFSSFRAAECQSRSPVRRLIHTSVERNGLVLRFSVTANAFLHHMVRNMVGVLLEIGAGRRPVHWSKEVLEARARVKAGMTASPNGLYLVSVSYPDKFGLAEYLDSGLEKKSGPWFFY
jgi:tRNA pseudouridine38-40 synthase